MAAGPVIALIDGEHDPAAVRDLLDRLERERGLAGVLLVGGAEKLRAGEGWGRTVRDDPEPALRELAPRAAAVADLADEPVLPASGKLRLAALALHLGLAFESPGLRLEPPRYERVPFDGPTGAVIGTGKRSGKTAVAGHWARLLDDPVIVCMGRGGPAEPELAEPGLAVDDLLRISREGRHAASDFIEDAVLAGVRTVGSRRVGGGLAGAPAETNLHEAAALAAGLGPGTLLFEGSGACVPPVEVDRTVCVMGPGADEPLADLRLLRADLVLAPEGLPAPRGAVRFRLEPEPAEPLPDGARVALFTTGAEHCTGVAPLVVSTALARRDGLGGDLDRAAAAGCDLYLTELKAAAIDTVAERALREGARVAFVRNRPVASGADIDALLGGLLR